MKIFWCVLEELNSDGEDPDLESDEMLTINKIFIKAQISRLFALFVQDGYVKNISHKYVSIVLLKI